MFSLVTISYFFQKRPLRSPSIQIHAFAQLDFLQPLFSYVTSSFRNTQYKFQKCLSPCDKELLPWCDNTVLNLFTYVGDGLLMLCSEHGLLVYLNTKGHQRLAGNPLREQRGLCRLMRNMTLFHPVMSLLLN